MKIKIGSVLCPVDFSRSSEHALRYALAFASSYGAELVLLHVVEIPVPAFPAVPGVPEIPPHVTVDVEARAAKELAGLLERTQCEYANTRSELVTGRPFLKIIDVARDVNVDLIVMGTHGRSGLAHMLIGSVAERVVRKAPCPVLTVKHPEHEFVMP